MKLRTPSYNALSLRLASVAPAFLPPLNRLPLFTKVTLLAFLLAALPLRADLLLEIAPAGTNALLTWSNSAAP